MVDAVGGPGGVAAGGQTGAGQSAGQPSSEEINKAIQENAGFVLFGNIMGMQREVKKNLDEAANSAK